MRDQYYKTQENDISRLWFKKHVAEFTIEGSLLRLRWAEPGTSNYYCGMIIHRCWLMIYGDIGEAVYQWSEVLTWEFLSGLNLDYFAGKCQASETGRGYKTWDADTAKDKIHAHLKQSTPEARAEFDTERGFENLFSKNEWMIFISQNGYTIFGDDFATLATIGDRIDIRCHSHLLAIQMAVEQNKQKPLAK